MTSDFIEQHFADAKPRPAAIIFAVIFPLSGENCPLRGFHSAERDPARLCSALGGRKTPAREAHSPSPFLSAHSSVRRSLAMIVSQFADAQTWLSIYSIHSTLLGIFRSWQGMCKCGDLSVNSVFGTISIFPNLFCLLPPVQTLHLRRDIPSLNTYQIKKIPGEKRAYTKRY